MAIVPSSRGWVNDTTAVWPPPTNVMGNLTRIENAPINDHNQYYSARAGVRGDQGPDGRDGPQGTKGPQGFQGFQGHTGFQGFQGKQGNKGPQGFQGKQGNKGPQGLQGPQGNKGPQGFQDVNGPQGLQGFQGPQGDGGSIGPMGNLGPASDPGPDGPMGTQGWDGPVPTPAPQGPDGLTGPMGVTGHTGPDGAKPAIVEVGGKWRALYCVESPDVRFEDVMSITAVGGETSIAVDPLFIQVCEPGVVVVSVVSDSLRSVSAVVVEGVVEFSCPLEKGERVAVVISGMRMGFVGMRFEEKTKEQAEVNTRRWK